QRLGPSAGAELAHALRGPTGACAVAVATARRDGADPTVTGTPVTYTVDVPGGTLVITERPDGEIEMTGPAVIVAEGEIDADWLEAATSA
ncbi:hypothetical protein ABZ214_11375, partial [Streptomyces iakyrus]